MVVKRWNLLLVQQSNTRAINIRQTVPVRVVIHQTIYEYCSCRCTERRIKPVNQSVDLYFAGGKTAACIGMQTGTQQRNSMILIVDEGKSLLYLLY